MAKDGAPEHLATGICAIAAAVLAAKDVRQEEYELAEKILGRKWPAKNDNPRELESIAGTFNRQMDVAIDACNRSHRRDDSRVTRRADLARDLDRAGLVLVEREMVAALIAKVRSAEICAVLDTLTAATAEHDGHDLGSELLEGEPVELVVTVTAASTSLPPDVLRLPVGGTITIGVIDADPDVDRMDGGSGELEASEIDGPYYPAGDEDRGPIGDYRDPGVND